MPPGCCERWRGRPAISFEQGVQGAEAQVARALGDARQLAQLLADVRGVPAVGRRGQPRDVARRQPQRLAELADRAARPVRREGADEAGLPRPVRLVHPHDQPLADVAREVEVDVGDARELLVEEAAEREAPLHGVDVREAREVADDGADARAAPAPRRQHVARGVRPAHLERDLAGQLQHLEVQQEEAREPVVGDERQLLLQPAGRLPPVRRRARVALGEARAGELRERAVGLRGGLRRAVAEVAGEVERAALGDLDGGPHGLRQVGEQRRHLGRRLQHVLAVAAPRRLARVEGGVGADGDEGVLQRPAPARVDVDVVRGHERQPAPPGELDQRPHPRPVAALEGPRAARPRAARRTPPAGAPRGPRRGRGRRARAAPPARPASRSR